MFKLIIIKYTQCKGISRYSCNNPHILVSGIKRSITSNQIDCRNNYRCKMRTMRFGLIPLPTSPAPDNVNEKVNDSIVPVSFIILSHKIL